MIKTYCIICYNIFTIPFPKENSRMHFPHIASDVRQIGYARVALYTSEASDETSAALPVAAPHRPEYGHRLMQSAVGTPSRLASGHRGTRARKSSLSLSLSLSFFLSFFLSFSLLLFLSLPSLLSLFLPSLSLSLSHTHTHTHKSHTHSLSLFLTPSHTVTLFLTLTQSHKHNILTHPILVYL